VTGRVCTVCANAQVAAIDHLRGTGTSVRAVARLYGRAKTTVARHAQHVAPTSAKFAVIVGADAQTGTPAPLSEAFRLAERARTARERLRALEQVRAATKLALRGRNDLDAEDRELLDANISAAEAAFRDASDFETAARALGGWREALHQRLDAAGDDEPFQVPFPTLAFSDGTRTMPEWLNPEHGKPSSYLVSAVSTGAAFPPATATGTVTPSVARSH
jgi:hypothetical protein